MKYFRWVFLTIWVLVSLPLAAGPGEQPVEVVVAMCRPLVSQIKNIEQLYEKDMIPLERIRLLCVFHEDELSDYQPAFDYVEENKLAWVQFEKIEGKVPVENLFRENKWTAQFKKIFTASRGIIFTGGMDIPPAIYGEESHLLTEATTPVRSMYEASFLFHLVGGKQNPTFSPFLVSRPGYPILAICLGAQTLNVAAGGTLVQDIPGEIYGCQTMEEVLRLDPEKIHSSTYMKKLNVLEEDLTPAFHRIRLKGNSIFVQRMDMKESDRPYILTSHHQAVERLGSGLAVTATSMDGRVVEAVEHITFKNVLGVQFHPEYEGLYRKGRFFKRGPGEPQAWNLRRFLLDHSPSMKFHQNLWQWFAGALRDQVR
jgi:putative glutamine amidotransferase